MPDATANLLDPAAIARGESLGVIARQIVEGYRVGEHRSPFHGFAIEFAQHREYTTGDDLRHLDWKVLGRTDRYYHQAVRAGHEFRRASPASMGASR